jgi:hypothetical protein
MPRYRFSGRQANFLTGRIISGALLPTQHTPSRREKTTLPPTTLVSAYSPWIIQTPTQTQRLSFPAIVLPPQAIAMAARTNTTQTSAQLL